ncbi:MAG: hypothetical protein GXP51_01285 [Deltaproteobacteria bacterium]|nr:hypothetical protein [Deltaproteobacteria bacterium]
MLQKPQPLLLFLSILLTLHLVPLCHAEQDPQKEAIKSTQIDKIHQQISESLATPSRWFDNFFSDPRLDEEPAGTSLRLRGSIIAEEGNLRFKGEAKVWLRLPNLKQRFHLILSNEDDDPRDETLKDARINHELDEREETTLALQYTQERSTEFSLTHQIGLDLEDGLNPQIRSRIRYSIPIAQKSVLTLAQAVYWENKEGFGEESRIDYDLPFSDNILARATGRGLFSESSNGYEWLGMLQWLRSFNDKKALAVGSYVAGETRPQNHVTEYDIFIKYRQKIIKKWLFIELKPEIKWARDKDFKATGIFTLTFEVQFYD